MKRIEILEKETKQIKLTIAPERITMKFPTGISANKKEKFKEIFLKVAEEAHDTDKTLRSKFNKNNASVTMHFGDTKGFHYLSFKLPAELLK